MTDLQQDTVRLAALAEQTDGLDVHFRPGSLHVPAILLLDVLGVTIVWDERAPRRCGCDIAEPPSSDAA